MTDTIYANLESFEGTVNGTVTEVFENHTRKLIVTNDSAVNDLQFYPKSIVDSSYITLKATETMTFDRFRTKTFSIVTTDSTPYRVWGIG